MSSDTDFALAVEDLTVSFDGFKAIDNLTFYIDKNASAAAAPASAAC